MQPVSRIEHASSLKNLADKERGVSLIEVLIALVVFALGVVGIAALQLRTIAMTMDSSQRSYVISKSQDLADRIRGNSLPAKDYLNAGDPYNSDGDYCLDVTKVCSDTESLDVASCTATDMAAFDLYDSFCVGDGSLQDQVMDWQVDVSCAFPNAVGVMTDTTECNELGATVSITTTWFARTAPDGVEADDPGQVDTMTLRFVP